MRKIYRLVLEILGKIILSAVGATVLYYFVSCGTGIFFAAVDHYYDLLTRVVPGIIALAAFLGALVTFDVKRYEDATQKYADSFAHALEKGKEQKLFSLKIIRTHKSILDTTDVQKKMGREDYIKKMRNDLGLSNSEDINSTLGDMHESYDQEWERRTLMTELAFLSFIYVFLALLFLPLAKPILTELPFVAGIGVFLNLILIGCILFDAIKLISKIVGYSRLHRWKYL